MNKSIIINTEEIQHYIKDIKKIPVITHERQDEIFKKLLERNTTETEKLELKKELITGNLRFVISIAKSYQGLGLDLMDLISEGNLGLIKASEEFDPSRGLKFISYAVWWVRQSILSSLNEDSRTIRIPSNIIQEMQKDNKQLETDFKDINNLCESKISYSVPNCICLDNQINEDGDTLIDIIPNKNADNPEEFLNSNSDEIKMKVHYMLSVLDEREKTIIERYFGLTGIESNLDELGEEFGCTKERVRQLRDKAIKKLRNESFAILNYL
jgi:RNA polymerase primary sigma factor